METEKQRNVELLVEEGVVKAVKVATELQLADVMTKALSTERHWMLIKRAAGME